ncbi:hypothetical protein [Niallia sp. 01092]|uniref:hypothetical protein n=1 Tax=unclassified Niallia TaxID=2837522 RepID=UPI003FD5D7B1
MDIQKYYKQTAAASLNASLISCIPLLFLVIFFIKMHFGKYGLWYLFPFVVYSVTSYIFYYIHQKRSQKAAAIRSTGAEKSLLQKKTVVLTFLPAPSLRMLIFDEEGIVVGEIKDEKFHLLRWYLPYFVDKLYPKSYGFYNSHDMLQYIFTIKGNVIEIKNKEGKRISKIVEQKTENVTKTEFMYEKNKIMMKKSLAFTDYQFNDAKGIELATLKKGWMPKEWSYRFMNPNLPLLSINHSAKNKEIIHLYALLTKIYVYRNH